VARVKEAAANQARQQVTELQQRLRQVQGERDKVNAQINEQVDAFRQNLSDDFLTRMKALSDLSANSTSVWWINSFVALLLIGIEITPVLVKMLSPIGPYDVKLDAMNNVETNEALLKRDTTNRIITYHYAQVETAERQADDVLMDVRTKLADDELRRTANRWKEARDTGSGTTLPQYINGARTDILTHRTAG
jgi:hypothetical protein